MLRDPHRQFKHVFPSRSEWRRVGEGDGGRRGRRLVWDNARVVIEADFVEREQLGGDHDEVVC